MTQPGSSNSSSVDDRGESPGGKHRIAIVGGGFGGLYTAHRLEKLLGRRSDVEIVLVSRDNFLLMTPLLFEVSSGTLDMRHASIPARDFLRSTRFIEATVREIDLDHRLVHAVASEGSAYRIPYDQLVLALGAITNRQMIPGSEFAFTFKNLADAVVLRNHVIERFERADAETNAERRKKLLTFVIIGGGLVGVELFGEMTAFVGEILRLYRRVDPKEIRFVLLQAADRIMPEIAPELAKYATDVLTKRRGVEIRTGTIVRRIEPGKVCLDDETIESDTILLAAGILPNPIVAGLPVEKDKRGHITVDATMRCPQRPEVWAIGDCARIPDPEGGFYPTLAQHAIREAKVLASNILAARDGGPLRPFVYTTRGLMGALGRCKAFGQISGLRLRGIPAWWVRRTYYLMHMAGWSRRLRIMIDWTFALFFRPDIVKLDLDTEDILLKRNAAAGAHATERGEADGSSPVQKIGATESSAKNQKAIPLHISTTDH